MSFTLPALPFAMNALEPHISEKTLSFHYGKHHQAYVTNLNNLTQNTPRADLPLEEVIRTSAHKEDLAAIFNNAAQVWNHTFFWESMKPKGGGKPVGDLASMIDKDFGSYEAFKEEFKKTAVSQFGSGWAWLVLEKGKLRITKTGNAHIPWAERVGGTPEVPLLSGSKPLLTCDVWEHAYYLDYQNRRPDYVDTFLNHLINWSFAEANLQKA